MSQPFEALPVPMQIGIHVGYLSIAVFAVIQAFKLRAARKVLKRYTTSATRYTLGKNAQRVPADQNFMVFASPLDCVEENLEDAATGVVRVRLVPEDELPEPIVTSLTLNFSRRLAAKTAGIAKRHKQRPE